MKQCGNCNVEVSEDREVCPNCETPFPAPEKKEPASNVTQFSNPEKSDATDGVKESGPQFDLSLSEASEVIKRYENLMSQYVEVFKKFGPLRFANAIEKMPDAIEEGDL